MKQITQQPALMPMPVELLPAPRTPEELQNRIEYVFENRTSDEGYAETYRYIPAYMKTRTDFMERLNQKAWKENWPIGRIVTIAKMIPLPGAEQMRFKDDPVPTFWPLS